MFNNKFGEFYFKDNELYLNIHNSSNLGDYDFFVNKLEETYLNINKKFYLKADLSKVKLGWDSQSKYKKLINLFSDNYKIADKYLTNVIIINCNTILVNVLRWLLYFHGMKHPIEFISKEL